MQDQLSISRIEPEVGETLGSALGSMNNLFKAHLTPGRTGLDDEKSCLNPDLKYLSKDAVQLEDSVFSQGEAMLGVDLERSNSNHSRSKILLGISSLGDHHAPAITSSHSTVLGEHLSEISTVVTSSASMSVSSSSPEDLSSFVSSSALNSSASCSSTATYSASSSSASTSLVSSSSAVTMVVSSSSAETSTVNSSSITAPLHASSTTVSVSTSVDNVHLTEYIPVYPIPVGPLQNANSSFLIEQDVFADPVSEASERVISEAFVLAEPDIEIETAIVSIPIGVTKPVVGTETVQTEPDIKIDTAIESIPIGVTKPVVGTKTVQTEPDIKIETAIESIPIVAAEHDVGTKTVFGTTLENTESYLVSSTEFDKSNKSTNNQSDPDESHKSENLRKMVGFDQELPVFKAQSDILKGNFINPDSQVTPKKSGLFSTSVETTFNPFMHTPKPFIPTQYQQSPGIRVPLYTGEGFTTPEKLINPEILAKPNLRDSFNSPSFLAAQAKFKYRPFNYRQVFK